MNSTLQIIINAVDNASSVLQNAAGDFDALGSAADMASTAFYAVAAAAVAAESAVLVAAMDSQVATVNLSSSIKDNIDIANDAAKGQGAFATELAFAHTQMNLAVDALHKLQAGGKANADQIDAQQQKVATLTGKFEELNGRMSLVGKSAADVQAMFDPAIQAGIALGYTVDQTTGSLNTFENVLGNPTTAIKALSTAQDLAREKGIDLATATNMVVMGMNGMGRGLQTSGIFIKDGIAGMEALDAIQQQVDGHAQAYAGTLRGQLAVAWALLNDQMIKIGNVQIPWLSDAGKFLLDLATGAGTARDQLKRFLDEIDKNTGVVTMFKEQWSIIVSIYKNGLEPAFRDLWTTLQPYMPYLKEFGGVVLVALGLAIVGIVEDVALLITGFVKLLDGGLQLTRWITDVFVGAFTKAYDAVEKVINAIEGLGSAAKKIGGGVAGAVGGAVNSVIKAFAAGGIVNGPTLAMVGEAGPEAIIPLSAFDGGPGLAGGGFGGGNGGINVYIQGGTYLDRGGAQTIAAALAQMIQAQLKLKRVA